MRTSPPTTALHARERWIATGSLLLGMISFTIAVAVANVVLPQIMTSLRVDLDYAQWILTGHGIAQTVVMPMVGWLTSLTGHRHLYLGSLALFCAGSVLSAMAWSIESLIFFQIVSGLGVGLMQPLITAIMYQIFPPKQRGLALGLSMVGWSFGPAIGPLLGGYLVEVSNWRAAFYVSVPLGIAGLVCAFICLPALARPARKTMDQCGLLTMTVALVTLLMALSQGRREGWDSSYILTLFAIASVATGLFLVQEWHSPSPLVDLRLFRYPLFTLGCLVVFISTTVFRGTGVLTIVFMQQVLQLTPLDVAWILLAGNIAYGIAVVVSGRLADTMNPYALVLAGLGIFALAFFWFARVNETVAVGTLVFLLALRLTSFGVMGSPNNLMTMQALPEEHVVMASGVFSLMRSISGTMGTAISATIYEQRYFSHVQHYAENNDLTAFGLQEALASVQHFLQWAGEMPALLAVQTEALLHERLLAEASMAAYQDYFFLAALVGVLSMLPALPWVEYLHGLRLMLGRSRPAPHPRTVAVPETVAALDSPAHAHAAPTARAEFGMRHAAYKE
jgi:EmrB/QacA subfamily drug resistance transporter